MRLVDANKLVVDARLGDDEIPYVSKAQIDEAPTVEAIPIQWLIQQMGRYNSNVYVANKFNYYKINMCGDCIPGIIDDWRRENGSNNISDK